jgi:hypothetical protein
LQFGHRASAHLRRRCRSRRSGLALGVSPVAGRRPAARRRRGLRRLRLTDAARPVLKGEQALMLRRRGTPGTRRQGVGAGDTATPGAKPFSTKADQALFEAPAPLACGNGANPGRAGLRHPPRSQPARDSPVAVRKADDGVARHSRHRRRQGRPLRGSPTATHGLNAAEIFAVAPPRPPAAGDNAGLQTRKFRNEARR